MKKWFIYASVVGLAAGVIYWLCKKGKSSTSTFQMTDKKVNCEATSLGEDKSQNTDAVEEMYRTKNESVQTVYERHTEASSIMKDAYSNIMENFVEYFSNKSNTNSKDENKEIVIDCESASVMKEIASLSDELDDLLR